jgi:hypothetical protein
MSSFLTVCPACDSLGPFSMYMIRDDDRILVTGAAGFVGWKLVSRIRQQCRHAIVIAVDIAFSQSQQEFCNGITYVILIVSYEVQMREHWNGCCRESYSAGGAGSM